MSRIPFWRIIVFGRHGIVLPGQAEPRQIMLNRNSVKLNSTFLRIQEEPPPKSGGLLFCAAGAKVIGCFFQMFENLTHVLCESASIRSFQAVGPEARRSHRNWKRYTPLRHVPERILPYTLCLRWFLCNRRCNKSSNRVNYSAIQLPSSSLAFFSSSSYGILMPRVGTDAQAAQLQVLTCITFTKVFIIILFSPRNIRGLQ